MGSDKALLQVGGRPMLEIVVDALAQVTSRILLVGSPRQRFVHLGLPAVPDIYPGSALGGLYTGLHEAGTQFIFAIACDMPFPSAALIRHLVSLREGHDVVVPRRGCHFEPLFAVYSQGCLDPMQRLLEAGNFRIFDFYPEVRTLYVDEGELAALDHDATAFININTPEEYRRVLSDQGNA